MLRRYVLPVAALLVCTALLTACGGSHATDTPAVTTPTAAPTTAPTTTAASAAAATRPAASATTGATTAPTPAAGSPSAVTGTRPANGITTGSVITGTKTTGSAAAGGAVTVFTDSQGRFSFSRPAAWTVGQSSAPNSVVQFNTTNPSGVVDISTESVSAGITPETYRDGALAEIKKGIPDAQQVGTTQLHLDTEPAIQIDYTGTVSGSRIYFSQIFALHKGTAYILTLGTQPTDIDKMKQQAILVIQTWKFLQ